MTGPRRQIRTRTDMVAALVATMAVLLSAIVGEAPAAVAQEDAPEQERPGTPIEDLPGELDGDWIGRMSLSGSFSLTQAGSTLTWSGSMPATVSVAIESGAVDGSVSGAGTGSLVGNIGDIGSMEGAWSAEYTGSISGHGRAWDLSQTISQTSTVTVQVPGVPAGSQTSSNSSTFEGSTTVTDLLLTCDHLTGRYDQEFKQGLQEIGFDENLQGIITLVRGTPSEEINDALDRFQEAALEAQGWIDEVGRSDEWAAFGVEAMVALAVLAAELSAELEGASSCPASQFDYLEAAAGIVRQALEAVIDAYARGVDVDNRDLLRLVTVALSTGIAGQPGAGEVIEGLRGVVEAQAEAYLVQVDGGDGSVLDDPEFLALVHVAAQMGWDLPTGDGSRFPASDILVALGEAP